MLEQVAPGACDVSIVDVWTDHTFFPYNRFVPWYKKMAKNPWMWKVMWKYASFYPSKRLTEESANLALHKRFRKCIDAHAPDLVLSVHPLCQDIPLRVRVDDASVASTRAPCALPGVIAPSAPMLHNSRVSLPSQTRPRDVSEPSLPVPGPWNQCGCRFRSP